MPKEPTQVFFVKRGIRILSQGIVGILTELGYTEGIIIGEVAGYTRDGGYRVSVNPEQGYVLYDGPLDNIGIETLHAIREDGLYGEILDFCGELFKIP